jgi:Protein of unknwon function (DUF3310).
MTTGGPFDTMPWGRPAPWGHTYDHWCAWDHGPCIDVRCDACPNRKEIYPLKSDYKPNADYNIPVGDAAVVLPNHYARFKIEPITFICENKLDFFQGNIVKYVCRHDAKNGVEDLKKAKRYLEMYIKFIQDDPTWPNK